MTINKDAPIVNPGAQVINDIKPKTENTGIKRTTTKKQIPSSQKSNHEKAKTLDQMLLQKTEPKSYNTIAKGKKSSIHQQKLKNNFSLVDKIDDFYQLFDGVSGDIQKLLKESTELKDQLEQFDDPAKKFEDQYATELKFIADSKSENVLYKIPRTILVYPDSNTSTIHRSENMKNIQKEGAEKFTADFEKTEEFKKYKEYKQLKDQFTTASNELFKYHNTQIKILEKKIKKIPDIIKKLDKKISQEYKTNEIGQSTDKLNELVILQNKYKKYKKLAAEFKNSNNNNFLKDANNLNSKLHTEYKKDKHRATLKNSKLDDLNQKKTGLDKKINNMGNLEFKTNG